MESKYSKYILIVLTALCVLLIGITSLRDGVMDPLRTGVGYFLIPIQSGVNKVGTGIQRADGFHQVEGRSGGKRETEG